MTDTLTTPSETPKKKRPGGWVSCLALIGIVVFVYDAAAADTSRVPMTDVITYLDGGAARATTPPAPGR